MPQIKFQGKQIRDSLRGEKSLRPLAEFDVNLG